MAFIPIDYITRKVIKKVLISKKKARDNSRAFFYLLIELLDNNHFHS